MTIINIGTYPPPYGGVSNHIKLLTEYLQKKGMNSQLIDCSYQHRREKKAAGIKVMRWTIAILYLFFHKKAILHFHNFSCKTSLAYYFLAFRHTIILSFHNERFLMEIERAPKIVQKMILKSINSAHTIIVDNEKCHPLAKTIISDESKIFVIPEFIPPSKIPEISGRSPIIEMKKKHRFLLSSNASHISFHNGADLYGIDMLIELVLLLSKENIDIALVFLLPQIGDEAYFLKLKEQINIYAISDRFLFVTDAIEEATSLWRLSDLVIRATNTDGISHSIFEALSVGTPVLASDCTQRPEGVILFKTRDLDDLYKKTKQVLSDISKAKDKIRNLHIANNADRFVGIYKSIIETRK